MNSVWVRLPSCFSKRLQKRDFLDIYLTTVFRVRNFQNNERCESSFFWNFENFIYISKIPKKCREKVLTFRENSILTGYLKLSLLRRQSTVNMLKNSPDILPIIKTNFFELDCLHSGQWISQKWCHSDFSTVWYHLPCWLSKGPLERNFSDIFVTKLFGIRNFRKLLALRIIFFSKVLEILSKFQKCREKLRKSFLFFT